MLIPREPSPVIEIHTGEEDYELDRDNTVIRLYSEEYETMNHVVHTREAMGQTAMKAIMLFNQPELISILDDNDFTMVWQKYPADDVVEYYTEYQMNSLDTDLS